MSRWINKSLDDGHLPRRESDFLIRLNGKALWAANYPYAYAEYRGRMPDRATVIRLYDAVQKHCPLRLSPDDPLLDWTIIHDEEYDDE